MNLSIKNLSNVSKNGCDNSDHQYVNPNLIKSKEFIGHSLTFGYFIILGFVILLISFIYSNTHPQYSRDLTSKINASAENRTSSVIVTAKQDSNILKTDFKNNGWLILTTSDTVKNPQKEAQRYAHMAKALKASDIIGVKVIDAENRTLGIAF